MGLSRGLQRVGTSRRLPRQTGTLPTRQRLLAFGLRNAFNGRRKQALKLIDSLQGLGDANDKLEAALPLRFKPAHR